MPRRTPRKRKLRKPWWKRKAVLVLLLLGFAIAAAAIVRIAVTRFGSDGVVEAPALTHFGPYRSGMSLREAFESLPPAGGEHTGLRLIEGNLEAWSARWHMLAGAQKSIDFSNFILREDVFGAAFLGHLLHKANDGVRIRVLLDSQGTSMSYRSARGSDWLDTLANTRRIEVKLFRPVASRLFDALATVNPSAAVGSEHDKILVCDRALGMIGGRNISTEYFAHPADLPKAFEDVDVILQGASVARGLTAAFETQYRSKLAHTNKPEKIDLTSYTEELSLAYQAMDAWLKGTTLEARLAHRIKELGLSWSDDLAKLPRSRGTLARVLITQVQAETRLLDSHTRLTARADVIAEGLSRLVQSARGHILIQSPYLVLSEAAIELLADAGRRGINITVYTNSPVSSDNAMSQAFFLDQWPELLARVPRLRLFVTGAQRTLHSKIMVFDDQVALVGTYNLDPVSMGINSEIMATIWSDAFARRVAAQPRQRIARGAAVVYEYKIKRDRRGQPLRDKEGRPIVAFGPKQHAPPAQWRSVQAYWALLRAADNLPGFSPLF